MPPTSCPLLGSELAIVKHSLTSSLLGSWRKRLKWYVNILTAEDDCFRDQNLHESSSAIRPGTWTVSDISILGHSGVAPSRLYVPHPLGATQRNIAGQNLPGRDSLLSVKRFVCRLLCHGNLPIQVGAEEQAATLGIQHGKATAQVI